MHTLKTGWVVQTFALAKSNESEGRKSRIRRSKEERKAMVESFLKKYQSSNNGNFPSLNLTHKEVGGSFYTVREIVREIIQENRVLGPAKFPPEVLNYQQDELGPLGSISIDPSTPLYITSNESHFVPNHHQTTREESISDGLCSGNENKRFDNERIINGYQVDVRIEESDKQTSEDLQTSEQLEAEKTSAASTANVTPLTEDIVVETFPLRPVPNIVDGLDTRSGVTNLNEIFEENETEMVKLEQGNGSAPIPLGQISSSANSNLEIEKKVESLTAVVLDTNSDSVEEEVVENFADPQLKSSNNFTTGGTVSDTHADTDVEIEVLHNDVLTSEINEQSQKIDVSKAINAPNGKSPNGSYASWEQVRTPEAVVTDNEANVEGEGNSHKGSNPMLDRINLASWEGASKKSAETETNPILVIFKWLVAAFIKLWSAFIKFWSE